MRLSKTDEQQYVDDEYLEALAEEEDTGVNHNHQHNEEDYSTGLQNEGGYLEGDEDGHWMPEKTTPVSTKHDTSILAATQGLTLAVQDVADSCTGDVKVRISYLTGGENDGTDPVRGYLPVNHVHRRVHRPDDSESVRVLPPPRIPRQLPVQRLQVLWDAPTVTIRVRNRHISHRDSEDGVLLTSHEHLTIYGRWGSDVLAAIFAATHRPSAGFSFGCQAAVVRTTRRLPLCWCMIQDGSSAPIAADARHKRGQKRVERGVSEHTLGDLASS